MRLKLDESPVAEALYRHVLTLPLLSERERRMAEDKLLLLRQRPRDPPSEPADVEYGAPYSSR